MINTKAICIINEYPRERQGDLFRKHTGDNNEQELVFGSTADVYKGFIIFDTVDYEKLPLGRYAIRMDDFVNRVIEDKLSPILVDKMPYQVYNIDMEELENGMSAVEFKLKIHLKWLPFMDVFPSNITEIDHVQKSDKHRIQIVGYSIINDEYKSTIDVDLRVKSLFEDYKTLFDFATRMTAVRASLFTAEREIIDHKGKIRRVGVKIEPSDDKLFVY